MFATLNEFKEALEIEAIQENKEMYRERLSKIMKEATINLIVISELLQKFKMNKVFVYQKFKVIQRDEVIGLVNEDYILFLKKEELGILHHATKEEEHMYLSGFFTKDFLKNHFVGAFFCSMRAFKKM